MDRLIGSIAIGACLILGACSDSSAKPSAEKSFQKSLSEKIHPGMPLSQAIQELKNLKVAVRYIPASEFKWNTMLPLKDKNLVPAAALGGTSDTLSKNWLMEGFVRVDVYLSVDNKVDDVESLPLYSGP
jgi:hypothetical protein